MGKSISGKMRKPNEYVIKENYVEGIYYDKNHKPKGAFLISLEDFEEVSTKELTNSIISGAEVTSSLYSTLIQ